LIYFIFFVSLRI